MKNKLPLIIITAGIIIALGFIFLGNSKRDKNPNSEKVSDSDAKTEQVSNTEIKDGIQYITIDAKGGYSPRITNAKAGIPTKLIVKTDSTYDCSSALVIKSLNYRKILPKTGEEIVDLGVPKAGTQIGGTCGMGMYSFMMNFE